MAKQPYDPHRKPVPKVQPSGPAHLDTTCAMASGSNPHCPACIAFGKKKADLVNEIKAMPEAERDAWRTGLGKHRLPPK